MKKKYYKCRDGSLYTKYTKDQVKTLINPCNFETFKPFLKEMDYAFDEKVYERLWNYYKDNTIFGRFISTMRLCAYRSFGYQDWEKHNERKN